MKNKKNLKNPTNENNKKTNRNNKHTRVSFFQSCIKNFGNVTKCVTNVIQNNDVWKQIVRQS